MESNNPSPMTRRVFLKKTTALSCGIAIAPLLVGLVDAVTLREYGQNYVTYTCGMFANANPEARTKYRTLDGKYCYWEWECPDWSVIGGIRRCQEAWAPGYPNEGKMALVKCYQQCGGEKKNPGDPPQPQE